MSEIYTSEKTLEGMKKVFEMTREELWNLQQKMPPTLRSVRGEWQDEKYQEVVRMVSEINAEIAARVEDIDRMERHVGRTLEHLQDYRRS